MSSRRKRISMTVVVSVPNRMTTAEARREVKTLITHQSNYSYDEGDVLAISVKSTRQQKGSDQ